MVEHMVYRDRAFQETFQTEDQGLHNQPGRQPPNTETAGYAYQFRYQYTIVYVQCLWQLVLYIF